MSIKILKDSKGQAIAESILGLTLLSAVILAAAALYQVMNADIMANKAARLVAWHGMLYQDLTESDLITKFGDNLKNTLMVDDTPGTYRDLVDPMDRDQPALLAADQMNDVRYRFSQLSPTFNYPSNGASALATQAGLNNSTITSIEVSIPLHDEAGIFKVASLRNLNPDCHRLESMIVGNDKNPVPECGEGESQFFAETDTDIPYDAIADEDRRHVKAKAALLSNGFVPLTEEQFSQSIANVAADGVPLAAFEGGTALLDWAGFDEVDAARGEDGLSTVATDQSRILPPELGTFVD